MKKDMYVLLSEVKYVNMKTDSLRISNPHDAMNFIQLYIYIYNCYKLSLGPRLKT